MKLAKFFGLGLVALLTLSGCGSNNSDAPASDTNDSVITPPDGNISNQAIDVILPVSSTILTTNSQVVTIDVRAFDSANNPYSEGNISIINSPDVKKGRDVGTFDKYSSAITNGTATFTYTAPASLETNTSSLYFGFYHDSNVSNIKTYTMSIVPETNQTVISSYKLVSSNLDDTTMSLNSIKSISYSIYEDAGIKVDDDAVISLRVTSENPSLVKLSDSFGNTDLDTLEISEKNTISVNLNSNTTSGLVPLKVEAKFRDSNGDEQTLIEVFNVVVFSGPPTAMSVTYISTSYESTGLYQENYTILVTDKYQNIVNTKPTLSLSMITGYAYDATDSQRLFSLPTIPTTPGDFPGAMDPVNNIFEVSGRNFSNVDLSNDFLFTFGNGYTYNASGKWDIDTAGVSSDQLKLVDNFEANATVDNLGFVVGHNYRQDTCRAGEESVAQIKVDGNTSTLSDDGIAHIKVDYPYYLGGKTVFIGVEMIGYTASGDITSKFGEVSKVTLRTTGFQDWTAPIPANTTNGTVNLLVALEDAPEWYRNGKFGGKIVTSDNVTYTTAIAHYQIGTCDNPGNTPGGAYLEIQGVTELEGKAGSITLQDIVVANEF